jgi:8-oxo-dGTP diphosphatase
MSTQAPASFNPDDTRPLTQVAVVIIERSTADGTRQVLFAQRPAGKAYAGYWEFPGGKIEAGESLEAAAIREIDEELGITIHSVTPWRTQRFSYPHAHVALQFCHTSDWSGAPQSREAQAFAWQDITAISLTPLLPALHHNDDEILRAVANTLPAA